MERKIPQHIAIIMDGNGRWAKAQGLPRTAGHKKGADTIRTIAIECNRLGVSVLTLYAFSTENWKRPQDEVDYLCKLPKLFFKRYIRELNERNIRVCFIGELERFPQETQKVISDAVSITAGNSGLTLNVAINYGSQREIVLAAQAYASDVLAKGELLPLDEERFSSYLMTAAYPPVDLLIRTSGELRISNFLLWQIAYAELIFTPVAWPDFDERALAECLEEYHRRDRRFGGISE